MISSSHEGTSVAAEEAIEIKIRMTPWSVDLIAKTSSEGF
jgi:hypothetical protein